VASRIEWVASASGTYYVKVSHTNEVSGTGFYDISVVNIDLYEPDNTPATSSSIPTDGTVQNHNIAPAGDIDFISFSAVSGTPYIIETSNLSVSCDTYIYVYGTDGTTLIDSDDDSGGDLASRISFTPSVSGTYYIVVRHYSDISGTGSYDIYVASIDFYEPDNTPATASPITTDGSVQSHTIAPTGDVDFISFTAVSGTPYVIETSNLSYNCDTDIYLYDTNGTTLIDSNDDSGGGLASRIEWTATADGTYYIEVRHFNDSSGTGSYDIKVQEGPIITSINPDSADQGETLNVTITGSNLTGATHVSFGTGITVNSYTVNSGSQITASITIGASATTGLRDVTVTTPVDTVIFEGGFSVTIPTHIVIGVSPGTG